MADASRNENVAIPREFGSLLRHNAQKLQIHEHDARHEPGPSTWSAQQTQEHAHRDTMHERKYSNRHGPRGARERTQPRHCTAWLWSICQMRDCALPGKRANHTPHMCRHLRRRRCDTWARKLSDPPRSSSTALWIVVTPRGHPGPLHVFAIVGRGCRAPEPS